MFLQIVEVLLQNRSVIFSMQYHFQQLCQQKTMMVQVKRLGVLSYEITGNVFDDGNGLLDNTVNGPGTNAGGINASTV